MDGSNDLPLPLWNVRHCCLTLVGHVRATGYYLRHAQVVLGTKRYSPDISSCVYPIFRRGLCTRGKPRSTYIRQLHESL